MTGRQRIFVDEYIKTGNATAAARHAGYANPNMQGARMLANDSIKAAISEQMKDIKSQNTAEAREVMEYLTAVLRGTEPGKYSVRERLRAAELLLRRLAPFSDIEREEREARIETLRAGLERLRANGKENVKIVSVVKILDGKAGEAFNDDRPVIE